MNNSLIRIIKIRDYSSLPLLNCIFNVVRFNINEIVSEVPVIHFFLGGLVGLSLVHIIIGSLPEATYSKIKAFKRVC